jgi:sugar/nucleoside kinase (ribokinase family)
VVGLDGFVDTILHVVKTRESLSSYTRLDGTLEFAERVSQAAGHSGNFELVTQMVKLGGNGPIMANALGGYGVKVTYIGNLGSPAIHPVFQELKERACVHSIAEPGYTDAIEFNDAKLMLGKHESLKQVNWENLIGHVPEPELVRIFSESHLIALVNWTMLTEMGDILKQLLARIAPQLQGAKRWLFFDLADPAKRSREDLAGVLQQVSDFQKHFRVILGLNLAECRQVGEVLGIAPPDEDFGEVTHHAARIQSILQLDTVVVHPTHFAAAADATGAKHVVGPFTAKPKLTTGAGDHFNAGFCLGRLLDFDLEGSVQLGVATSGFYVRHASSPHLVEMCEFLESL